MVVNFKNSKLKKTLIVLVIWGASCYAGEPHGFGLVNFGDPKSKAIQKLLKKYNFKQQGDNIVGKNNSTLNSSQNAVWIKGFPLSKKYKVTVWFFFNENDKFYKYEIESKPIPAQKGEDEIIRMSAFLGQVFVKKFGEPESRHDLSYLKLKDGYISMYMKWKFKNNKVFIAYKLTGDDCNVIATAINTKLESEEFNKLKSEKQDVNVDEAVNSF